MFSHTQNKISRLISAWFFLFIASLVFPRSGQAASVKESVRRGNHLYGQGKFADSLKKYEQALEKAPESDIVNFNAGTALYKRQQYDEAIDHFQKAILGDDASLRARAYYNLGDSFYKSGIGKEKVDINAAMTALRESLKHLASALALDKKDQDAQYNYDFVNKELERLREEQQKQQQQQSDAQQPGKQENPLQSQSDASQAQEQKDGQQSSGEQSSSDDRQVHSGSVPGAEELTKSEAERLLQNYRQTEEPQGLLHVFEEKHETGAVIKDW